MPHFFIKTEDISGDEIKITEKSTLHHLSRVMRLKTGEKLLLADENQTSYTAQVLEIAPKYIISRILKREKADHFLKTELYLAQGVLKSDAQAFVIQKATELGVKGIYPLLTDNTVVKPSVIDAKIEKWNKYALEAVKQCERTDIPTVFERASIEKLLESGEFATIIACVERSQDETLKKALKNVKNELNNLTNKEIGYIIITGGITSMLGFSAIVEDLFLKNSAVMNLGIIGIRNNKYSNAYGTIKYFVEKLELREKEYTMFSEEKIEEMMATRKKVGASSVIGKIFDRIFD